MSPDHNAGPVRPPSGGSGGDQAATPRFEIVLRGYDRRQVEEHISGLERTIAQQRDELQKRGGASSTETTSVFEPASKKPAASASSGSGLNPEMISSFTTRLQSILQAAEEEAEEVRGNARAFAQAEEQASRARLDELERRRQAVLSELGRVRTQLDGLLSASAGSAGSSGSSAAADKAKETDSATTAARADSGRPEVPSPPRPAGTPQSIGGRPSGGPGGPGGPGPGQPHPAINRPTGQPAGPGRPGGPLPMRGGQPSPPQHSGQPGLPKPPQPPSGPQSGPSGQPSGPGQPPGPSGPGQPKPRPTPRPRPTPAGSSLPGVEMTQGPVEPGKRNGNGRSDDDGGFGSGAR